MNYLTFFSRILLCTGTTNIFVENIWWNMIIGLFVGILSSIIGKYVIECIKSLWFYRLYKSMGVEKIFSTQQKGESHIIREIKSSKKLRVFAMRGTTFSDEENSCIAKEALKNSNLKQYYLVSSLANKYLKDRAKEIDDPNLIAGVEKSISCFEGFSKNHYNIEYRLHAENVRFRIILFDSHLYLSFMEESKRAKKTDILKIKKSSPLYKTFSTLFDELWGKYEPSEELI